MPETPLYPLSFIPIHQYRLWGGGRLADWLKVPLPDDEPIGEAWLLSDRDDCSSLVANGPLKDRTISQLIQDAPDRMLGALATRFARFPLLLKFLDVRKMLSVQVHPSDAKAELVPGGDTGKTEAWVVLEADPGSRIYAGLKPGVTADDLRSLSRRNVDESLASFAPAAGQAVLIEAGTVHSLGDGVVVFEVQQNSDITFRLYDWDHTDPKIGQARPLQVEQALACVDFAQGVIQPVEPVAEEDASGRRERILNCPHFTLWRVSSAAPFWVGANDELRILVCLDGKGLIEYQDAGFDLEKGGVTLLPACVGVCRLRPEGEITVLEIAAPRQP